MSVTWRLRPLLRPVCWLCGHRNSCRRGTIVMWSAMCGRCHWMPRWLREYKRTVEPWL